MNRREALAAFLAAAVLRGCASRDPGGPTVPAITFDFSAVELLGAAYERTSISESDIDALLANRGIRAMVDNTIKYVPQPIELFRTSIREYVETRQITAGRFGIRTSASRLPQAHAAMQAIRARELEIIDGLRATLAPLWPSVELPSATCHFVLAGASDGFVLDNDLQPDCFVALDRCEGAHDIDGVIVNVAHELYHVGQKAARVRARLHNAVNVATAPPLTRLLVTVLDEGSANYAVDPARMSGTGPYFSMWRERFVRNADPYQVAQNFALFDTIFAALDRGTMTWEAAYAEGFGGANDARLYFVGYQMMKAVHEAQGSSDVRGAFVRPPHLFFAEYVRLAREGRAAARFAPETETKLLAMV
jgi:hypothetical protein